MPEAVVPSPRRFEGLLVLLKMLADPHAINVVHDDTRAEFSSNLVHQLAAKKVALFTDIPYKSGEMPQDSCQVCTRALAV